MIAMTLVAATDVSGSRRAEDIGEHCKEVWTAADRASASVVDIALYDSWMLTRRAGRWFQISLTQVDISGGHRIG
jgi:hypothetical protein